MTIDIHSLTTLGPLLATSPTLESELRQAADMNQFLRIVAAHAQRHATTVDVDGLRTQLQAQLGQASGTSGTELADQQLADVAGGSFNDCDHPSHSPFRF